jgi:hypothetical protein
LLGMPGAGLCILGLCGTIFSIMKDFFIDYGKSVVPMR